MQALDGIKVLDLSQGIAGPYATRLLADYGANVIKVEPPAGDVARTLPPFLDDKAGAERSGTFLYLNTNKRSIVLDPANPDDTATLERLIAEADLVVESYAPAERAEAALTWERVQRLNPAATLVSITDFGLDGPYKDYRLTELSLYGFGGAMYCQGLVTREPVRMAGISALIECGTAIATALFAAAIARTKGHPGQHIEVSLAEIQFGSPDRRVQTMLTWQFSNTRTLRGVLNARGMPSGIYPCLDGFVEFTSAASRPERVAAMLDHADWLNDPDFSDPDKRSDPEVVERWNANFFVWCLERTKADIWAEARRAGVLCGPVSEPADLMSDPVLLERGVWTTTSHAEMGDVTVPGRLFMMEDGGFEMRRTAPLLGEHTDEIRADGFSLPGAEPQPLPAPATMSEPGSSTAHRDMPLAGLRIVDLTIVIAGTYGTMVLADLGAEVIKVENGNAMQPMTRSMRRRPTEDPLTLSAYPHARLGERPWNYWATQVSMYRNKKSFTCDFRKPEGLELLRRLVSTADVIVENNAAGLLDKFGITRQWMEEANPNIIIVRAPGFALTGPYANARALGWHVEAAAGLSAQRGYADHDPSANNNIYAGDFMAGLNIAVATMAAVLHRNHTGRGQMLEVSQAEGVLPLIAHELMDYSLNKRALGARGNEDAHGRFPCGVYPASSPGPATEGLDRWIAIHVQTDEQWASLRRIMGDPEWARDSRFDTNDGRREHAAELDQHIAEWTREHDDYELMHRLQAVGIAAAPILEASRMLDEPHLKARGFLRPHRLDTGDVYQFPGPLYRLHGTPIEFFQDPVTLGEHNEYVYREILGVSDEEYAELEAAGHIATEFHESIP